MPAASGETVYLDYAATAPLCEEALDAMQPYLRCGRSASDRSNANSLHSSGRRAFASLEASRKAIARSLGAARPSEIIFTSGATEADNSAIFGLSLAARDARRAGSDDSSAPKVITSAIEHKAVTRPAKALAKLGFEVEFIEPDRDGFIEASRLERCIDDNTVLVSVQMANSEIGTIQPVEQLAGIAHSHGALFHTDATQALGKIAIDLASLRVDAASFSSHKIGGPSGIGALYLKTRTPFTAFMNGGDQEGGKRSGTQNICASAGFAAACEAAQGAQAREHARLMVLRDILYDRMSSFDAVQPTVDVEPGSLDHLPNIANFLVSGMESETLIIRYDSLGFEVSGGSACASSSLDPSHVLLSMGISPDEARGELRVSMGRYTMQEDIDAFIDATAKVLDWHLRSGS